MPKQSAKNKLKIILDCLAMLAMTLKDSFCTSSLVFNLNISYERNKKI